MGQIYQEALFIILPAALENCEEGLTLKSQCDQALRHVKHSGPDIRKTCVVQEAVVQWITRLRGHDRCSRVIHDLLDIIENELLVVDVHERITSTMLLAKLQNLAARAEADKAYLLSPTPRDITLQIIESSRCGKIKGHDEFTDGEELLSLLNALVAPFDRHDAVTLAGLSGRV
jgi:hypothetical protein